MAGFKCPVGAVDLIFEKKSTDQILSPIDLNFLESSPTFLDMSLCRGRRALLKTGLGTLR
jgi:hypothetical protein